MTRKTKMWRSIVPYELDEGDEDALVRLAWELHNLYPKLEEYQRTKSITVATDCMEWLAKTLEMDDELKLPNKDENLTELKNE